MQSHKNELKGDEPFLVGLSPSFWAHVPMLAEQVASLRSTEQGVLWFRDTPVSKCSIVGCVIYAQRRATSHCYVVDDGTGLMDCVQWTDEDALLPLVGQELTLQPMFKVGSLVRVYGKIMHKTDNDSTCEIHITTMKSISEREEYQHWLQCQDQMFTAPLEVLEELGDKLTQKVADRTNLPSADDKVGAWRLFGIHCHCSGLVKEELLYCKCIAKPEPLDPEFAFRDKLLTMLLQSRRAKFSYRDVAQDAALLAFADTVTSSSHKSTQLMRNTFLCLRNDGILYLLDESTDTYLFITRRHVLEPFLQKQQQRQQQQQPFQEPPQYLEHVPKVRLQVVRRSLFLQSQAATSDMGK